MASSITFIEGFLRSVNLPEKEKEQLVEKYGELLASNGLSEENQLSTLNFEVVKSLGVPPIHAAAIVEAAQKFGNKDTPSHSTLPVGEQGVIMVPSALFNRLTRYLEFSAKEMAIVKRKRFDVWTASKRSKEEQAEFKNQLIEFYDARDNSDRNNILCCVLSRYYPSHQVRAGHIWPRSTLGEGLDEFGLSAEDLQNPRNGLLLGESIELAFDQKKVCIVYDPLTTKLKFVVLDPSLNSSLASPSTSLTFAHLHQRALNLPDQAFPFRRLLSWHAQCSFRHAFHMGWIDKPTFEFFQDFSYLSENASLPPFDPDDVGDEETE